MDRDEWGAMLGDDVTVEADLRWKLFQAERSIATMQRQADDRRDIDNEVYRINQRRIRDTKIALAALWRHQTPPAITGW